MRTAPPEHLAAAVELIDRGDTGPASLGLTMRSAAAAAGVSRSTIYRHWATAAALNGDAARWAAAHPDTWQQRLIVELDRVDLGPALRRTLQHAEIDLGYGARTAAASWPMADPARIDVVDWERRWLAILEAVLEKTIASRGERWAVGASARLAALGLTIAIEGSMILGPGLLGPSSEQRRELTLERRADAAATCERFLLQLVEPGPSIGPSDHQLDILRTWGPPEMAPSASRILSSIADTVVQAPPDRPSPIVPPRAIDVGQLARHLGISERRVFHHWPTAADLNGDLAEFALEREWQRVEELATRTLDHAMRVDDGAVGGVLVGALAELVGAPAAHTHFRFTVALADPQVFLRLAGLIERWRAWQRSTFLAMLAVASWNRPSNPDGDLSTDMHFAGIAGAQRLVASHPELALETVDHPRGPRSALGQVCLHLARAALPADPSTAPAQASG